MSADKPTLIVAGGGTGGHVWAGVAVADAWKARFGVDARVVFVGAAGAIEERLVPKAGYPLQVLRVGALNRVSLGRKLRTAFQLPFSLLKSLMIVLRERPQAVLGVGGYASGPLVLMAKLFARTAILEQNAVPGLTNRLLGRIVDRVFSAFPGVEKSFPSGKVVVTGNPVRSVMQPLPAASRAPFTVFVFGGSLGAVPMNTLVIEAFPLLRDLKLRIIHQTGEKDYDRVMKAHQDARTGARVEKFIDDMTACYREASLLICRAGASTLSEIASVGRAAILVPLPTAADNHQEKNARIFVDAKAAWLVPQSSRAEDLAKIIRDAVSNSSQLDKMESAVRVFSKPSAAKDIVDRLTQ